MPRSLVLAASLLVAGAASGCQSVPSDKGIYDGPAFGAIAGFVTTPGGEAIDGVTVNAQGLSAVTDASGLYRIEGVDPAEMIVLSFQREGFARGYARASLISWETVSADKALLPIDGYGTFDTRDGGLVEVAVGGGDGPARPLSVDFGAGGVVDASGAPYDGQVRVEVTWVNPYTDDVLGAPADLRALAYPEDVGAGSGASTKDATEPAQLVSYGMGDVSLFDEDGEPLQLADGEVAAVSMPITNGDLESYYRVRVGETLPSWTWSEEWGVCLQEGEGEIVEGEDGDLYFEFEAPHFTWWNADAPYVSTTGCGRVVDMLGFPVRGAEVVAQGGVTSAIAYTDEDGYYEIPVLAGDTVTMYGTTHVADRNWRDQTSLSITCEDLFGAHFCDVTPQGINGACVPFQDIEIEVCRESGVIMTEDITSHLTTVEEGNGDRMRAFFWDAPGDPAFCDSPWDSLEPDSCETFTPGDFATHAIDDADGLPVELRSVGDWVQISTGREGYEMELTESHGKPYYTYKTEAFDPTSESYVEKNEIDFRGGDVLSALAPGAPSDGVGPIDEVNWVTMPHPVELQNLQGPQSVNVDSGMTIQWTPRGDSQGLFIFGASQGSDQNVICNCADDGSFTLPGGAMRDLGTGSGAAMSIFRPELSWTPGPDGLPIRVQAFAGAAMEMELR